MKKYIAAILILLSVMSIISILFCGILFIGYDVPYSDSCEYMMYVSIVILGACVTAIICCFVKKTGVTLSVSVALSATAALSIFLLNNCQKTKLMHRIFDDESFTSLLGRICADDLRYGSHWLRYALVTLLIIALYAAIAVIAAVIKKKKALRQA